MNPDILRDYLARMMRFAIREHLAAEQTGDECQSTMALGSLTAFETLQLTFQDQLGPLPPDIQEFSRQTRGSTKLQ